MLQWARNLTDAEDGFLKDKRVLIPDRDPLYTKKFRQTLRAAGARCLRMPRWSPNLNSYCESWVRTAKREVFDRMIFFSEQQIRRVATCFVDHYNKERPHKGLDYRRPVEPDIPPPLDGPVKCRERLGGLLKSYYREAA